MRLRRLWNDPLILPPAPLDSHTKPFNLGSCSAQEMIIESAAVGHWTSIEIQGEKKGVIDSINGPKGVNFLLMRECNFKERKGIRMKMAEKRWEWNILTKATAHKSASVQSLEGFGLRQHGPVRC